MEMYIVANIKMDDLTALEAISGKLMVHFIKETLKMDLGMVKANGKKKKPNTMEATARASNKDMDSSTFLVAIFIREILFKIKNKAMGKCFGPMVAFIKANGKMELSMGKVKFI